MKSKSVRVKQSRRAFSLLEIIAVVFISSLILYLAVGQSRKGEIRFQTEAVAQELASQLLLKRQQAMREGVGLGLAFPGQGSFVSQAYYEVEGLTQLRQTKSRTWGREFPQAFASWGAAAGEQLVQPDSSSPLSSFSGVAAQDPVILFLPSGKLVCRGFATDGDFLYLRVGSAPQGNGGGTDSAELEGLKQAWVLSISLEGIISLDAAPDFPPPTRSYSPKLASLPSPKKSLGLAPQVESLLTSPELFEYPDGTLRLLGPANEVQLNVEAKSPEGESLFVKWHCDGGQFSHDSDWQPMEYSPESDSWRASSLWSTPPTQVDTEHEITAFVRDARGLSNNKSSRNAITIEVVPDKTGLICEEFTSQTQASSAGFSPLTKKYYWLTAMKLDGSGARRLTEPVESYGGFPIQTSLSPNGQHIALHTPSGVRIINLRGEEVASTYNPYTVDEVAIYYPIRWNEDGTGMLTLKYESSKVSLFELLVSKEKRELFEVPLTHGFRQSFFPTIMKSVNRDGTKILVESGRQTGIFPTYYLEVYDAIERKSKVIPNGFAANLILSPTGKWIEQAGWPDFDRELLNLETGESRVLISKNDKLPGGNPEFQPDEKGIKYEARDSVTNELSIVLMDLNGEVKYQKSGVLSAKFTPDSRFLIVSRADGEILRVDLLTHKEQIMQQKGGKPRTVRLVTNNFE